MPTKPGFYGVRVGRVPGVYSTWDACQKQVLGFSCARFKKFERIEDARTFVHLPPSPRSSKHSSVSLALQSRAVESVVFDQGDESLRPSLLPGTNSTQNYPVGPTGSEDPEVGKRGFKQGHVEKKVTTKRRHGDSESYGPVLEIDEEGTTASNDAETMRERHAKRSRHEATHLSASTYPKSHSRTKMSTPGSVTGPLAVFFAQYTIFEYNPDGSATDEFYRLCDLYGWSKDDQQKQVAKQVFQDALTMQFNDSYGTDVDDLTKWQALCAKLRMDPVPENLNACREAIRSTHVNLVDLVDSFDTQKKVPIFSTVVALSEYTKDHGKFFPKDNVHAGSLLKFLLRQIMNPELSRNERRSWTQWARV